jgi:hypothetical protein
MNKWVAIWGGCWSCCSILRIICFHVVLALYYLAHVANAGDSSGGELFIYAAWIRRLLFSVGFDAGGLVRRQRYT